MKNYWYVEMCIYPSYRDRILPPIIQKLTSLYSMWISIGNETTYMYNIVMPLTLNFICGVNVFWLLKVTLDTLCTVGYKNRNNRVYWMFDVCVKYDKRSELHCVNASPFPILRPIHFSQLIMLYDICTELHDDIDMNRTAVYRFGYRIYTFFFFTKPEHHVLHLQCNS